MRELRIVVCLVIMPLLLSGCSHFGQGKPTCEEASVLFSQGNYKASLDKYQQVLANYPAVGDRALFEMGIIYSHPKNEQKDYGKALECFEKVIKAYPQSGYRQDSEMMTFYLSNVTIKDKTIAAQQTQIETLQQEVGTKESEVATLQKKIEEMDRKFFRFVMRNGSADKILVEKKDRRLTLISKGEVLKTYRIALGGNPNGPKESADDNKTPEGNYIIDARNKDSRYHLSLHISYPNAKDKKRAKELGVSPGGDIMIHGLKNGFSRVGSAHTEVDWTKGCIAVTDEEIEEIYRLAKDGTVVEIRP